MHQTPPTLSARDASMISAVKPGPNLSPRDVRVQARLNHPAMAKQGSAQPMGLFTSALLAHQQKVDKQGRYIGQDKARQVSSQSSGRLRAWSAQQQKMLRLQATALPASPHPSVSQSPASASMQFQLKELAAGELVPQIDHAATVAYKPRQSTPSRLQKSQKGQKSQRAKAGVRPRTNASQHKLDQITCNGITTPNKITPSSLSSVLDDKGERLSSPSGYWDWLTSLDINPSPEHPAALRTGHDPMWYSGPMNI